MLIVHVRLRDSSESGGGTPGDKSTSQLTVRNMAKLQRKTPSELNNNGRDPNAPVDEALSYWLKSRQAMIGLIHLHSKKPRLSSP